MKKLILLAALSVSLSTAALAQEERHMPLHENAPWSYTGASEAARWGDLDPDYHMCKDGKSQSPINIQEYAQDPNLAPLMPAYVPAPLDMVNNGHSLQVNLAPGSKMTVGGKTYDLLQFHFHTPSEHYIDGAPYPMEVHFLHRSPQDGELAMISAMVRLGAHNRVIEGLWQNAPAPGGHRSVENFSILASDLLPRDLRYYKYTGSITTPPCIEGMQWYILQRPIEISEDQLRAFQALFPVNARPVQPLNGRRVVGQ